MKQQIITVQKNQRKRLEDAGLNIGLMYGNAGQAGGTGSTGGGTEQGVSAISPQAVSMGLQLKGLELQNELTKAEVRKTTAESDKIKNESSKVKTEENSIKQEIEESKTRIKDIIAGIPAKQQKYYVEKANQALMESVENLNYSIKDLNERKTKNMELESHVILKQYERLESEIEGLDIDKEIEESKTRIKDIIAGKIERLLGVNGLGVIRKIFGVILLAIAVKLFAANIKGLFI